MDESLTWVMPMSDAYPLAERMMTHLATLYGAQKVKSMYLDDDNAIMAANQSWQLFLESANVEIIKRILHTLPTLDRQWPPSLAEFVRMYRDFDRVEHRTYDALPAPKVQTDVGRAALAEMKARLRVSPNTKP